MLVIRRIAYVVDTVLYAILLHVSGDQRYKVSIEIRPIEVEMTDWRGQVIPSLISHESRSEEYGSGEGQETEKITFEVAECKLYNEGRDVLEGKVWKGNGGGMKSFEALDGRRKRRLHEEIDGAQRRRNRLKVFV